MHRRAALAVLLALVLVVAAACDGSDDGESRSSTSTSRRRPTTTTTAPPSSTTTGGGATTTTAAPPPSSTTAPQGSCGPATSFITEAIAATDELDGRAGTYTVTNCRLATSSPIWAAADVVPNPGAPIRPATALLERIGAIWTVSAYGTGSIGCPAPPNVRAELSVTC